MSLLWQILLPILLMILTILAIMTWALIKEDYTNSWEDED